MWFRLWGWKADGGLVLSAVFLPSHYPSAGDPAREREHVSSFCVSISSLPWGARVARGALYDKLWGLRLEIAVWVGPVRWRDSNPQRDSNRWQQNVWRTSLSHERPHKCPEHRGGRCHSEEDAPAVVVPAQFFALWVIRQKEDRALCVSALPLANPLSELQD